MQRASLTINRVCWRGRYVISERIRSASWFPELTDGFHTMVMSGIGDHLMQKGFFYFSAHHRHKKDLIEENPRSLLGRGAEGLILIDTALQTKQSVPVVAIAGHRNIRGFTNVVLDQRRAAELTLRHLQQLGHRHIAFMRGQPFSSDSLTRRQTIVAAAKELDLLIAPELAAQLERDISSPELGYSVVQALLRTRRPFSAIVSFNDMAAIGAIRALRDANLRVPEDVSVLGFDDMNLVRDERIPTPLPVPPEPPTFEFIPKHRPEEQNYSHSEIHCTQIGGDGQHVKPDKPIRKLFRTMLVQVAVTEI
jgi:DNA-binding LacI/PurR family transcriptional regulator